MENVTLCLFSMMQGEDCMQDEYVREEPIKEKSQEEKEIDLMASIIKTKKELAEVRKNYEYAEGELIDYYAYQMKALLSKLDYLIKQVKQLGLELDIVNETYIRKNKVV